MTELNLLLAISIPTKVNADNAITKYSILDQFWVSSSLDIAKACVNPIDITDHFPVGLSLRMKLDTDTSTSIYSRRSITRSGKVAFRVFLSNLIIDSDLGDHNTVMNNYIRSLMKSYEAAFPLKENLPKDHNYAPWISDKLKLCIQRKSRLYKMYLKGNLSRVVYTELKNRLTNVFRRSKRLYYVKLFYRAGTNSERIWYIFNDRRPSPLCMIKINIL